MQSRPPRHTRRGWPRRSRKRSARSTLPPPERQGELLHSVALPVAEKIAKAFEARFPNVASARRTFRRGAQLPAASHKGASQIYACDGNAELGCPRISHFISWQRNCSRPTFPKAAVGMVASGPHLSLRHRLHYQADYGCGHPTNLADLLDRRWMDKLVQVPGNAGTIMTDASKWPPPPMPRGRSTQGPWAPHAGS